MRKYAQPVAAGAMIGALAAGFLALPSVLPPALADEEPVRSLLMSADELFREPLDGDDFVKPDWTVEPWVSTEVISRSSVKKVGYGQTSFVAISRTASGTYSSDGLASPHIHYPGIVKNDGPDTFLVIVPYKGGATFVGPKGSCVTSKYGVFC